jgi:hypothetical protein
MKILVNGGATVNLVALKTVKVINLRLHENDNLCIRIINRTSIPITHVVRFKIKIVGIDYDVKAFIMPENVSYSIILSRPWMRLAKLWNSYKHN